MVLFGVPVQHRRAVIDADFLAVRFDDAFRVIQQVIRIDDGDADLAVFQSAVLARESRADLLLGAQEVEDAAQLVVAGFRGHEVVEAGDLVERRDGAPPVRGDAVARVPD